MSAVSDLDQLLGHIIVKLTKALENLTTAQNALDESEQALSVLHGTNVPEAIEVLTAAQTISDQLFEQWDLVKGVRTTVETYSHNLAVEKSASTPPSIPHPSNWPCGSTDSAEWDADWARDQLSQLPEFRKGGRTQGFTFDRDGQRQRWTSGYDDVLSERANLMLMNSDLFPTLPNQDAAPEVAKHVETKVAASMQRGDIHGVVLVNRAMCRGSLNCRRAIEAILPLGSTLTVWEMGSTAPIVIRGKARP
ncbi:DddA-like double-stranded DNA deaminase toxin [Saccharopolyspora shandongensis]|uniref:DddA-like double-stranded DNA deaminase toxin n=1 Tax=Saccharopolyspora shandongensis TaxID=418495 RepID=UPI0034266DC7